MSSKKINKDLPYNHDLEFALRNIGLKKYYGYAGVFENPKEYRKAIKEWSKHVSKRVYELTEYDERLREIVLSHLKYLEDMIKKVPDGKTEFQIIPIMMGIVNNLIGYDWMGKINRNVFFFQSRGQQLKDLEAKAEVTTKEYIEAYRDSEKRKKEIIENLKKKGMSLYQIADIMNLSIYMVKKYLK